MNDNEKHLIVDIETLGVLCNSVILSIGAVVFDFEEEQSFKQLVENGFYVKLDVPSQISKLKLKVDESTVAWWKTQGDKAKDVLYPRPYDKTPEKALAEFSSFIEKSDYNFKESYVFSRGNFDFPILDYFYAQVGMKKPYNHWKIRDLKTMFDVLTGNTNGQYNLLNGEPKEFIKHNCLHDCALDALRSIEIFKIATQE